LHGIGCFGNLSGSDLGNYRKKKTVFEIAEEAERPTTKLLVEASAD